MSLAMPRSRLILGFAALAVRLGGATATVAYSIEFVIFGHASSNIE